MKGGRVARICPIKLGGPHLDSEMGETMNPNQPLFVLSNSGFQSFPALKIQTWATQPRLQFPLIRGNWKFDRCGFY
jgi:hypothetical protein